MRFLVLTFVVASLAGCGDGAGDGLACGAGTHEAGGKTFGTTTATHVLVARAWLASSGGEVGERSVASNVCMPYNRSAERRA